MGKPLMPAPATNTMHFQTLLICAIASLLCGGCATTPDNPAALVGNTKVLWRQSAAENVSTLDHRQVNTKDVFYIYVNESHAGYENAASGGLAPEERLMPDGSMLDLLNMLKEVGFFGENGGVSIGGADPVAYIASLSYKPMKWIAVTHNGRSTVMTTLPKELPKEQLNDKIRDRIRIFGQSLQLVIAASRTTLARDFSSDDAVRLRREAERAQREGRNGPSNNQPHTPDTFERQR